MTRRLNAALLLAVAFGGACTIPGTGKPAPPAADPVVRSGGAITVATVRPGALDPVTAATATARTIVSLLCDTLVTIDAATGAVRPGLAESWVVSDGGRSLHVKLGRKHRFHDGTRLDSKAVVSSLVRLADPNTGSHLADLLEPVAGFKEYREAVNQGDNRPSLFGGARVIEPYSFEILLTRAEPQFVRTLANPVTAPVQVEAATRDGAAFTTNPVCAGPYQPIEPYHSSAETLRLHRAPTYGGANAGFTNGGRGWADEITFRFASDETAAFEAWKRGEADVADVPEDRIDEARTAHGDGVVSAPNGHIEYIGLPAGEDSPYRSPEVRQAFAAAIDRARISQDVYGGGRLPATGFIPPMVGTAYRPQACSFAKPAGEVALPTAPIPLYFNDEFRHRRLAETVAAQWEEALGVTVQPMPLSWDEYVRRAGSPQGFDGAFRMSWSARAADPVAYVRAVAHSTQAGATNLSRFNDPLVDAALNKEVDGAADEGDRIVALHRVEDRLCQSLPVIPVVFGQAHMIMRRERVTAAREDEAVLGRDGTALLRELVVGGTAP